MPDGSPFSSIPDAETLEERFTFIESETTRQNLAICFQYVIFLTVVRSLYKQGGPVPLSLNRDIVVHTASIVESCLYYCVSRLIKLGEVDPDKLEKNWKNIGQGTIHKFTDIEQIVWVRQSKVANVFRK